VRQVYAEITAKIGDTNLWLLGGGELVGQFYDANLLDEIILGMTPVTLGKGAPLLPRRITSENLAFRTAELIGQRLRISRHSKSGFSPSIATTTSRTLIECAGRARR